MNAIKSGTELDWESVRKAGELIVKQARDIGFCPPEAIDIHAMRADYCCNAMMAIVKALKLSPQVPNDTAKIPDEELQMRFEEAERAACAWMERANAIRNRMGQP